MRLKGINREKCDRERMRLGLKEIERVWDKEWERVRERSEGEEKREIEKSVIDREREWERYRL